MTSSIRSFVVLLGLVAVLTGCGGGVNILNINAKTKTSDMIINNSSLQSDAEIVTGKALYNEQLMQAVVEIQSHTNDSQKLYYKFSWFDSDGFPLPETSWSFVPLLGNEHKVLTGTASAPRAEKCEFAIRRRSTDDRENQ
jgi:uncharacterized protein YcfL